MTSDAVARFVHVLAHPDTCAHAGVMYDCVCTHVFARQVEETRRKDLSLRLRRRMRGVRQGGFPVLGAGTAAQFERLRATHSYYRALCEHIASTIAHGGAPVGYCALCALPTLFHVRGRRWHQPRLPR